MVAVALDRRPATWAEYEALGEHRRAEYTDGEIVTAPFPSGRHQDAAGRLWLLLLQSVPRGYGVRHGWGWKPGRDEFGPDVMVYPQTDEDVRCTGTPVLCVEVLSGNLANDYVVKQAKYAQAGLDHYWILDPDAALLDVLRRDGEHYRLARQVTRETPQDLDLGITRVRVDLAALLT